jgi:hypothetical protein
MRQLISIRSIVLIAVAIHLDFHMGRPHHWEGSLGWEYHWLFGLVSLFLFGWYVARKWPERPWLVLAVNGLLGLFVGQIIEPLGEVLFYRESLRNVYPPERWIVFGEFALAGLVGAVLGILLFLASRRRHQAVQRS